MSVYQYNGHQYQLTSIAMTWTDAEAQAVALGGHLVTVNDAAENQWLADTFLSQASYCWIGYSDAAWEGNWVWADGSPTSFTNWRSGEPNNSTTSDPNGEDYGQFYRSSNVWNDAENGDNPRHGIIEIPQIPVSGTVTIAGTAAEDQTLTATASLSDPNGLGTIEYRWFADGNAIADAVASTLTLTQAQVGKAISVTASYTDGAGAAEAVSSAATDPVANVNDAPTGGVTMTGTARLGNLLTARNTLADEDGIGTIAYQWLRAGNLIPEATDDQYRITAADVGQELSVRAAYVDAYGTAEQVASAGVMVRTPIPGVTITPTNGTTTREDGRAVVFMVRLDAAPTREVTIGFRSSDPSEGTVAVRSLTFTANNWNQPQSLRINGVQDYDDDGAVRYSVTAAISTLDVDYRRISIPAIELRNAPDVTAAGVDRDIPRYLAETGGPHRDHFVGLDGPDRLYGQFDMDDLRGGIGNDRLYGGYDDDVLEGGEGDDLLYGEQDDDYLDGGPGNDTLDGGLGTDTMIGGPGNDTYYLSYDAPDIIDDRGLPGDSDTVVMPYVMTRYTLPASVENGLIQGGDSDSALTGNARNNRLTGNDGDNALSGAGGADLLSGGVGNDRCDGGTGNDTLNGGAGNDTLTGGDGNDTVDGGNGNDIIVGGSGAGNDSYRGGAGVDTVRYTSARGAIAVDLAGGRANGSDIGRDTLSGIENVIGGQGSDTIIGDGAANTLDGYAGNDVLDGGGGSDRMIGGTGNDTFVVRQGGDLAVEAAGGGTDTVRSYLASYTLPANVENGRIMRSGAAGLTGNGSNNSLRGGSGNDTLSGGAGNDTLAGGAGSDTCTGGAGADTFRFVTTSEGTDRLTDFRSGTDKIQVVGPNFGLSTGALSASRLVRAGAALTSGAAVFIYNDASGALSFDRNGNGAGGVAQIATLVGGPTLRAGDIQVAAA